MSKSKIIACRVHCINTAHMKKVVTWIIEGGGEGVILQKRGSPYEQGRSSSLVKFKVLPSTDLLTTNTTVIVEHRTR